MLRSLILKGGGAAAARNAAWKKLLPGSATSANHYSSSNKSTTLKAKKGQPKTKSKSKSASQESYDEAAEEALVVEGARRRRLALDEEDPSLDVLPDGRSLFTSAPSLSKLTRQDSCTYFKFSKEGLDAVLPEGLPSGMTAEFDESLRPALLVRQSFLDLRDNFRRIVDPVMGYSDSKGPKARKQIVLDGPVSCGKSIALAMLVHWARDEGWLVFYVPAGRQWTHGGFFYKNPNTGLWDTPALAESVLQDFLKRNESHLKQLPCQISDPIPLGEGADVGWKKDIDSITMPEGSTLHDLVTKGITDNHAAIGVVVRLRKELSLVKSIPVLIAIDQYNSWFTFSGYEEPITTHSRQQIHARQLAMVNSFRSMMHDDMMVGAFSHSTAVGKLRKDLPDVPADARISLPRYSIDEAATVSHYYLRQRLIRPEAFSENNWKKIYYLSNGNGAEMRWLMPLMR